MRKLRVAYSDVARYEREVATLPDKKTKAKAPDRKSRAQAKTRAKQLKAEAKKKGKDAKNAAPELSGATVSAALANSRPFAERLLYDDELRDNIRTFLESSQKILDELSGEKPSRIVSRLWDDDKLRTQVESAAEAAQEGSKRVRGETEKRSGGNFGKVFLVISAIIAFLMINPRTGPEARRITKDLYQAVSSR